MNDIRRTILWAAFAFSMVLLWDQWQLHNGRPATFFPAPVKTAEAPVAKSADKGATDSKANDVPVSNNTMAGEVPNQAAPSQPAQRQRVNIETDLLKLSFDTEGASLVKTELLKYSDAENPDQPVVLLDQSKSRLYLSQSGLIAPQGAMPTHKTNYSWVNGPTRFKEGEDQLKLKFVSEVVNQVQLVKTYTISRHSYAMLVEHEVINQGQAAVAPQLYVQLLRDGNPPPGESSFYSTFTGPAIYTPAQKYQKVEFSEIEKNKATYEKKADQGYVAMVQHYFASAWILPNDMSREFFARKVDSNLYSVGMIAALKEIAPGQSQKISTQFYIGPQEEKKLEALYPGLELVKDYGWLTILAKPLYWLLDHLNEMLHNWGWSIVALVLLLKIAFYWLNAQAYRSMAKMKAVNPKVMEMRERLKDNPQQMQMEMMKIYREEKVNPLGGCFPIAIQIPVFIALYWVLLSTVEMRNAPWILWVHDLSAKDPFYILPVLMTLTTLLQTWLNPTPPDPVQAKLMWIMPLAFSVMFFVFPAGLVLYWLTNNILSIAQQWLINKQMGVLGK
jgi:YidC/Oxa1 family membrane protein insertase